MPNQIKCKNCKDVIQSTARWDFKRCKCGACFIDGGDEYTRYGGYPEDMIIIKEDGTECELKDIIMEQQTTRDQNTI